MKVEHELDLVHEPQEQFDIDHPVVLRHFTYLSFTMALVDLSGLPEHRFDDVESLQDLQTLFAIDSQVSLCSFAGPPVKDSSHENFVEALFCGFSHDS